MMRWGNSRSGRHFCGAGSLPTEHFRYGIDSTLRAEIRQILRRNDLPFEFGLDFHIGVEFQPLAPVPNHCGPEILVVHAKIWRTLLILRANRCLVVNGRWEISRSVGLIVLSELSSRTTIACPPIVNKPILLILAITSGTVTYRIQGGVPSLELVSKLFQLPRVQQDVGVSCRSENRRSLRPGGLQHDIETVHF